MDTPKHIFNIYILDIFILGRKINLHNLKKFIFIVPYILYSCLLFSDLPIYGNHFLVNIHQRTETTGKFLDVRKADIDTKLLA